MSTFQHVSARSQQVGPGFKKRFPIKSLEETQAAFREKVVKKTLFFSVTFTWGF